MSSPRLPISVCIIAGAEATRIRRVLASVAEWTSEIIVVINTEVADGTDRIAAEFGAQVFREPWKGHIAQKNSAAAKATQPWLLGLDADEEISPRLRAEIEQALTTPGDHAAFSFPRCTTSSGRWIRHGDWYPDRKTRLWLRGQAEWGGVNPHDKLIVTGRVGRLRNDLLHYHEESPDRQLDKLISYADTFARHCAEQGRTVSQFDVVFRPAWRFLRCYFFRLGFLDGKPGFTIAWLGAFYTFLRYNKALELQRQARQPQIAPMVAGTKRHLLIYEPRVEGHHVTNLALVVADLLAAGFQLTLALDARPEPAARMRAGLGDLWTQVRVLPAHGQSDAEKINFIATALAESGAEQVFLTNFDEIASTLLRRAALGILPPKNLRGRIGGSYSRPRFVAGGWSPNRWLKSAGFARLQRQGWFRQLLFPDALLASELKTKYPGAPFFPLPDPVPDNFPADAATARRECELPPGKKVFLFYGGAYRRKGLHLAVAAMRQLPADSAAFLLCAGEQPHDAAIAQGLAELAAQGRARVVNRYVTTAEEKMFFAASDFVLLPYVGHFGSSGVLARAVGAHKPVIASDEQLVGHLVRTHKLGPLFVTGEIPALRAAIETALQAPATDIARWQAAAKTYAVQCTRETFRQAVVGAFQRTRV